jgi:diguanylate cyclase (GGDEF)-like protein/PAS domain S-box-containing protein
MDMRDAAEQSRLDLLKSLEILDTPPEEFFDRVTKLAARICDTPMSAITLIDERRQWFKSAFGWNPPETPREISLCTHTVLSKRPLVVPDARKDPCFKENPFVTGEHGLVFYAGAPLIGMDGLVLGALAVLDRKPRTLAEMQFATLEMLAAQVVLHLEMRRQRNQLERVAAERDRINAALLRQTAHLKEAQRIAEIGSWEFDPQSERIAWSDEIYRIFGISRENFSESYEAFKALVHPDDRSRLLDAVQLALQGKQPLDLEHRIRRPDGEERYVHERADLERPALLENGDARRILAGTVQDVTLLHKSQESLILIEACISRLNDAIIITEAYPLDEPGPRIVFVNDAFEFESGYRREEVFGKSPRILQGPKTQRAELDRIRSALENNMPVLAELITYRKNGEEFWIEVDISPVIDAKGRLTHFAAIARNITERKQRLADLARTHRALQMLTRCNEALIKVENEHELLEQICRLAVEVGGYEAAWVGYAQDDEARSIKPVAHAGAWHERADLGAIGISWSEHVPEGRGPAGRAIHSGLPVVSEDVAKDPSFAPWLTLAQQYGYRGVICLPLHNMDRVFGVLALLSAEVRRVSDEEIKLLQELAGNLAFGIRHVRSEQMRRRIEEAVSKLAAAVSASSDTEFFEKLAQNMADALDAQAAFVARLVPGDTPAIRTLRTLGMAVDGKVEKNFDYILDGAYRECFERDASCVVNGQQLPDTGRLASFTTYTHVCRRLDDSSARPAGLLCVLFRKPVEEIDFITSTLQIFAARAAAELERQETDERIRMQASLLDKAQDAIMVCNITGRISFWNKSAERIFGWTAKEAIERSKYDLIVEDVAGYEQGVIMTVEKGDWLGEVKMHRKDGSTLMVEAHWTLMKDESGKPEAILAIDTDITQRKEAEHEVERLAFFDPLTGLPNRRLLMDRLRHALAASSRSRHTGALLFIDLDNFKALNDTLGHDKGDMLLKQVAQRLETCAPRKSDTVARLGGDEFVVMLEDLSENAQDAAAQAEIVGEKIIAIFTEPFHLDGHEHHTTPSIGVTLFDKQTKDVDELLKRADLAMYQAKAAGRNAIRFFDPDMQTVVSARVALESDLRQSLQQHEFFLQYQRQADDTGRTIGAEALVRWQHPRRGLVSPALFIPLAEETGMILQLGQWVLESACVQLAIWGGKPETSHLSVAVNVSSRQFRHPEFVKQVLDVLERTGARPQNLKLELTESLLVENVEATIIKMSTLKEHGVGFSLDDFGTGYSSLSYLKRLPLDQLKIDQSFVRDVLTDANDAAIARTIVALGQTLGLEVIAEGVETADQRDFLAQNGCHAYQGYLFSRPLAAEDFLTA